MLNPPSWFVAPDILVMIAMKAIKQEASDHCFLIGASIVALSGYAALHIYTPGHGLNYSSEVKIGFFTVGLIRAAAGMSAGVCLAAAASSFSGMRFGYVMSSVIELLIAALIVYIFKFAPITPDYDFAFVLVAGAAVYMMAFQDGVVSTFFDRIGKRLSGALRDAALYLFLFHYPMLLLFDRLFGTSFLHRPFITAMMFGAMTAYAIGFGLKRIMVYAGGDDQCTALLHVSVPV